ncbi:MAG: S8 family serine peptidase, partial [Candidatus Sedimenticola sp. 1PA]
MAKEMNFTTKTIAGSLFLLMGAGIASGGELTANLQKVISESDGVESIPVIVRFSDKLNIRKLRNEVERSLVSRGLDKRARKSERKRSKRVAMVNGLKKKNRAAKRLLKKYLRMYGEQPGMKALWAINAVATDIPAYLLDDLAALPGIESITHNAVLNAPGTGIPTTQPNLWNLDMINAPQVWNQTLNTGQGVVVGIMDTGVDISNSDINARWRSANGWFDPYGQNPTPADVNGHGTQVAGLIVGGDNGGTGWQVGVAPGAQWIGAKIFDNTDNSTLAAIHQGYQWMLDPDDDPATTSDIPDIVNNSWSLENTTNQCVNEFSQDIALLKEAGVAVVFSAGNYGDGLGDTSVSPPNNPQVVSVGSVSDTYAISGFSSQGPSACDGGFFPHLVAPGENVLTYGLGELSYWSVSGTSFAAPHVSGILALLKSAFPDATVSELEAAIVSTASDLGVAGADDTFGYGLVDALAAYQSLVVPATLPGNLQFNAATYSADENAGNLLVTVSRGGGSDGAVSVNYQTTDGTAVAGQDYQVASGTLDFADGEVSRTISISILDDTVYEVDESFTLSLSNPTGGALLGTQTNASVTLLDDDPLPPVDVDADGFSANLDCNDNDASIYPGAAEIVGDGVDQDCNGYDLTINVSYATYDVLIDKLGVLATTELGGAAALKVKVDHIDGS